MRVKYVLSEVLVGLWRNVTMTIAMVITMMVSLTLLGASVLLLFQVNIMKDVYYERIEASVFLVTDVKDADKASLKAQLDADKELVREARFETKEEAFARFSEIYEDAPDFVAATKKEALPESFRVKLVNPDRFDEFNAKYGEAPGVDTILDQKKLLEQVFSVLGSLQKLALIIALVQAVAALLLVINTIQVAAFSKRREVAVMKLVGASNWFIQAPFVLEAVAAGLVGALLAWGMLVVGKKYVYDGMLDPLNSLLLDMPWGNVNLMLPLLALAATTISSITAWFGLRFYIRV